MDILLAPVMIFMAMLVVTLSCLGLPLIPFSSPLWIPYLQRRLFRSRYKPLRLFAIAAIPLPGLFVYVTLIAGMMAIAGDEAVSRATLVREFSGQTAWGTVIMGLPISGFSFALWAWLERQRRRTNEPTPQDNLWPNRPLKYGVPLLLGLWLVAANYMANYKSLDDAVQAKDLKLAAWRLHFNLEGVGPDNGHLSRGTMTERSSQSSLLDVALEGRDKDMALLLMKHGANKNMNSYVMTDGFVTRTDGTWIILATPIFRKDREMVEFMLDQGADVNAQVNGWTPLHEAAVRNTPDIIELLLRREADRFARTRDKETPMDLAVEKGNREAIDVLLRYVGADSALIRAIAEKRIDVCSELIKKGQNPNVPYKSREGAMLYPLYRAADSTPEILDLLLTTGANPKTLSGPSSSQETALHRAARSNRVDQLRVFLRHGVLCDSRDQSGRTLIQAAAQAGSPDVVAFLAEMGMDVKAKSLLKDSSPSGEVNALFLALTNDEHHSHDAVQILLEKGADPNESAPATPLECAIHRVDPECVSLLLDHGAQLRAFDAHGDRRPLKALAGQMFRAPEEAKAKQPDMIAIAKLLVRHGVGPVALNEAREAASRAGNTDLAAYLESVPGHIATK